jgi:tetratricopeptide (TPR) repeat protein
MLQQALAIQHDIGEKSNYAGTLCDLGAVSMQKGDLQQARKLFDQALSTQQQLGEVGSAAETRMAMAELACHSGRPSEAEQLARAALNVFQAQNEPNAEISAAAVLARSLLEQGKRDEARASLEAPRKLAEKSADLSTRLSFGVAQARVLAGTGDLAGGERAARRVLGEAPKDLFRLRLEALLALSEIQAGASNKTLGREQLQEVLRAAQEKGFALIAERATVDLHP